MERQLQNGMINLAAWVVDSTVATLVITGFLSDSQSRQAVQIVKPLVLRDLSNVFTSLTEEQPDYNK
ncbi:hypothetical protein [Sporolituus thermophilus]|uniref:Uncharacterized protein n=1 Tax=Sporolituus thermophilus DSM 23256 TaxID=1123285 RepID=A0A1G7JMV2_9FIRM|nr:hypothetical protein [Sporolituus thermophilus]SDF26221.1 hypothetical protein SAMN05660235_01006 [Sporolituus thermophilus DSM 23256]